MLKFGTCAALAIAATFTAGATASAAREPAIEQTPIKAEVFFGDLNLASAEGEETLNARIRTVAYDLCEPHLRGNLRGYVDNRRCFRNAIASTHQQVAFVLAKARQGQDFAATNRTLVVVAAR